MRAEAVLKGASGAEFSPDRKYRYFLWRFWDFTRPPANFVMLNPSTADEARNDPTVERCQRRAQAMRYGGIVVTNIFAYRSTDPRALYKVGEPIGRKNEAAIMKAAGMAGIVVCAWGTHGDLHGRGFEVSGALRHAHPEKIHHLGLTSGGHPRHPLYVSYLVGPEPWR